MDNERNIDNDKEREFEEISIIGKTYVLSSDSSLSRKNVYFELDLGDYKVNCPCFPFISQLLPCFSDIK